MQACHMNTDHEHSGKWTEAFLISNCTELFKANSERDTSASFQNCCESLKTQCAVLVDD